MPRMVSASAPDAVLHRALLRPLPELTTLVVRGEERLTWLGRMITSDVKALGVGAGAYSLLTNKTGRILAEVWLIVAADRLLLGVRRDLAEAVREHLEAHLVMEDAELSIDEGNAWWIAYGPECAKVGGEATRLDGCAGEGQLGTLGFSVLAVAHDATPNLADELTLHSGAELATPEAWERVRIERLVPTYGVDFEPGAYPQEARLERFAVSFEKGCYVGQEAVYMLEKRGHAARRLVLLELAGTAPPPRGAEVTAEDGTVAGTVTSACETNERSLALAMLRYKHTATGTVLRVAEHTATVIAPTD